MKRRSRAACLAAALLFPCMAQAHPLRDALRSVRADPSDLALPADLVAPDPFRLGVVRELMHDPLSAPARARQTAEELLRSTAPADVEARLSRLIDTSADRYAAQAFDAGVSPDEFSSLPEPARGPVSVLAAAVLRAQEEVDAALQGLDPKVRERLIEQMKAQLADALPDPERLSAGDTWLEKDEQLLESAGKVRVDRILSAGRGLLEALQRELPRLRALSGGNWVAKKTVLKTRAGTVVLGSPGPDLFEEEAALIVDPGGDDVYRGAATAARPGKVRLIVDLGGDDRYLGSGFGSLGAGLFGVDILVDASGSDAYVAEDAALGAGLFGLGVVWDMEGDDLYRARAFSQGAGAFGVGMLIDGSGTDFYQSSYLSQGAGYVKGAGLLMDETGNDTYVSGFSEPDPRGYIENYGSFHQGEVFQSLSQGFATGWRDKASGGVGLLLDGAGNDTYKIDYFGQGAGYWFSWGLLYDRSGNDVYQARRYAQGAGVHLAVGTLLDAAGNDRYSSWAVSQGCGHDYALGLLWDGQGDDVYTADWTSMGASNAMGIGLLRDQGGEDRYITSQPAMSYWDDKRGAAGIGLLLHSDGPGHFSLAQSTRGWNSSPWGAGLAEQGGADWELDSPAPEGADLSLYNGLAERDGKFLRARLARAQGLGERTRLSELLAVASGWGMNGDVPLEAKRALLAEDPAHALPFLLEWINPKDVYARMTLEEYFIRAPQARAALENALAREEPSSPNAAKDAQTRRALACYYLGQLRSHDAFAALTKALADASWRVRGAAARALGVSQSAALRERLVRLSDLLDKPEPQSLRAWFQQGEKSETLAVIAPLVPSGKDWADLAEGISQENTVDPVARKAAELAMAKPAALKEFVQARIARLRDHAGVPELVKTLRDDNPEPRRWAAYALGKMREAPEALGPALDDPNYGVREAAADSLALIGMPSLPALRRALGSGEPRARALAYKALGGILDKSLRAALLKGLDDPDAFARLHAFRALADGKAKGLWDIRPKLLRRMAKDENPWIRDLASRLLSP